MQWLLIGGIVGCLLLPACSGSDRKAAGLLETARFEEQKFNREHALQLYREIVRAYPDSGSAAEARRAITRLGTDAGDTQPAL